MEHCDASSLSFTLNLIDKLGTDELTVSHSRLKHNHIRPIVWFDGELASLQQIFIHQPKSYVLASRLLYRLYVSGGLRVARPADRVSKSIKWNGLGRARSSAGQATLEARSIPFHCKFDSVSQV